MSSSKSSFSGASVDLSGITFESSSAQEQQTEDEKKVALDRHKAFLLGSRRGPSDGTPHLAGHSEEATTAPLFSGTVLDRAQLNIFKQYGLLGEHIVNPKRLVKECSDPSGKCPALPIKDDPRIFLNVSAPWSAFICGSQGSGKSHTLSCILENCLLFSSLGRLPHPLTGLVFHYDTFSSYGSNQVCEAAYICSSGISVRVMVSPTNYWRMKDAYENLPGLPSGAQKPEVVAMRFQDRHLDVTKMKTLMSVSNKESDVPLYIEVVVRILREMAVESKGASGFSYDAFRRRLDNEPFTGQQLLPLKIRLDLLEGFLDRPVKVEQTEVPTHMNTKAGKKAKQRLLEDIAQKREDKRATQDRAWKFEPGVLTIIDLSCPFVDDNAACALFNICLELFLESTSNVGRIVALDEAHKYMTSSASALAFTENILQVIRQQRHLATRVVIATQEPTVSPKLIDLSTMTIVHRFTSPVWFRTLRNHLAGVSVFNNVNGTEANTSHTEADANRDVVQIFAEIVGLKVGEALLFSPTAILNGSLVVEDFSMDDKSREEVSAVIDLFKKLGTGWVKMSVRKRLTEDGGRSTMAI